MLLYAVPLGLAFESPKERYTLSMGATHLKMVASKCPTLISFISHQKSEAMPQSLVTNYVHIIFGTKYRERLIIEPVENNLFTYLASVCKELECHPVKVGGYLDHVHILCALTQKIALMKLIQVVKANSSKWMKTQHESLSNFYWQDGYAAFSISNKNIDMVSNYIANQKEHHKNQTFQDEYLAYLKKYNINYDERYIWD